MKKSITIFALALLSSFNVATAKNSTTAKNTANEIKFVTFADPTLISSELGNLKKSSKTIEEVIASDSKIIESTVSVTKKPVAKKRVKKSQIKLNKSAFQN